MFVHRHIKAEWLKAPRTLWVKCVYLALLLW
jgi:hypothetical protein